MSSLPLLRCAIALMVLIGAAACGGGDPALSVGEALAADPIAGSSQLVLSITNDGDGDDELLEVESEHAVAIEIHQTLIEDGRARMEPRQTVEIPADTRVSFRPGGLHLMIIAPDDEVALGGTFPVTLRFERSEPIVVDASVVDLLDLTESTFDDPAADATEVPS